MATKSGNTEVDRTDPLRSYFGGILRADTEWQVMWYLNDNVLGDVEPTEASMGTNKGFMGSIPPFVVAECSGNLRPFTIYCKSIVHA